VIYRHKTNIHNYNKHCSANEDFSSFRNQRTLLAFEIYATQHLIDYNLAEVVGIEKGYSDEI